MAINTKHAWLSSAILAVAAVLLCGKLSGEEVGTNVLTGTIGDSPGLALIFGDDLESAERLLSIVEPEKSSKYSIFPPAWSNAVWPSPTGGWTLLARTASSGVFMPSIDSANENPKCQRGEVVRQNPSALMAAGCHP